MPFSWRKIPFIVAVLVLGTFASGGALTTSQPPRAHAAVFEYRDSHPGAMVPVIVQVDDTRDPFDLIRDAGGSVTNVLGVIHAVGAEIPGDRVDELASARGVTWVSLDGAISSTAQPNNDPIADSTAAASVYPQEVHADTAWNAGDYGQGVGVAIVDTGVYASKDFNSSGPNRLVVSGGRTDGTSADGYGHGSHIAGLVAGNGKNSNGRYVGVAPQANIINVKVGDDAGFATVSDVINGLQFVLDNQARYNIRVVNLSLRSDVAQSYTTDPLDAAVELLTFRGILVVVAVGNTGMVSDAVSYAPANDPFVLSIGAVDDMSTPDYKDDVVPAWSSRGLTQDNIQKPDVYVPGRRLVSVLSPGSVLATMFPQNIIGNDYFSLSGTSMAAGVASGTAALVFQAHADWTPGQMKAALVQSSLALPASPATRVAQVDRAIALNKPPTDNSLNIKPNFLLLQAAGIANPQSISWGSVSWGSISWGSISWGSISWGSVSWGSVSWGNVAD